MNNKFNTIIFYRFAFAIVADGHADTKFGLGTGAQNDFYGRSWMISMPIKTRSLWIGPQIRYYRDYDKVNPNSSDYSMSDNEWNRWQYRIENFTDGF